MRMLFYLSEGTLDERVRQLTEELDNERATSAKLRTEKDTLATRCHELLVAPRILGIRGKNQDST
jgi:hypothetical protein